MKLKGYLFFFILFLVVAGCAKDKSNTSNDSIVIARIGNDYEITLKDLRQYVADWNYNRRFSDKSEAYKIALDELINNQLKRFDFFDRNLNENQDLMKKIRPVVNYALISAYFDKEFMQKYINEKSAAEAYKQMDKEVNIIDVMLPNPLTPTEKSLDSLKDLASEIEKELISNKNLIEIRKAYSSKKPVISERKVSWSESLSEPVANAAFNLQPGSTKIAQSYEGLHIIKVINVRKIELEPFAEIKDKIIEDLQKGYYQVFNDEYDRFRYGFVDKSSIKWNEDGLNQIVNWSKDDKFYLGAYKDTIKNAISNNNNFEILSYNKGKVDLKEFLRLLEEVIILSPQTDIGSLNVKEFILDAVYDDNVVKAALKAGLEKELFNPYTKNKIIKDRITYLYNQAVIEESIPEATPEALQKFYDDHKDPVFYQLKKVNIYARIYSDSSKAAEEIKQINNGIPFEKISDRWFVKTYIRERDGSLNSYRSQEPPYLAEAAFKLELNEVAGPVEYYDAEKGKQFAVIKSIRIMPEKQLSYDEVKGKKATEEFKNFYRQKITDELISKLRQEYEVEIFEDELSDAIADKL